jgi:hypothetical protein
VGRGPGKNYIETIIPIPSESLKKEQYVYNTGVGRSAVGTVPT